MFNTIANIIMKVMLEMPLESTMVTGFPLETEIMILCIITAQVYTVGVGGTTVASTLTSMDCT